MIKFTLKDYEIAREMFGSNSKHQCKIVKHLRENGTLEKFDEVFCIVYRKEDLDNSYGWLVPKICLI